MTPARFLAIEKPSIRFYHSQKLRTKTLKVLDSIDQGDDATRHRTALSDVVMELTKTGMSYFFLKPLDLVKAGMVLRRSASMSIGGIQRILSPIIRNVIGHLNDEQLRKIAKFIRELM